MHYAKAPAIDSTYRINGGVTFASIRQRKMERRRKAIEAYVNKQAASTPTTLTLWQRFVTFITNLFTNGAA